MTVFGVFVAAEDVDGVDKGEFVEVGESVEVVESVGIVEPEPSDLEVDAGKEDGSVEAKEVVMTVVAAAEVDVLFLDPLLDDETAEDEVGINAEVGLEFLESEDEEGTGPDEDSEPVGLACVGIELGNVVGASEVGGTAPELGTVLGGWEDPVTMNLVAGVAGEVPPVCCSFVEE